MAYNMKEVIDLLYAEKPVAVLFIGRNLMSYEPLQRNTGAEIPILCCYAA